MDSIQDNSLRDRQHFEKNSTTIKFKRTGKFCVTNNKRSCERALCNHITLLVFHFQTETFVFCFLTSDRLLAHHATV